MTADIKKHKVKRTLSILCSSSNFLSQPELLIQVTLLLFKTLKERFYEAGIRISEPESAETKAEMHWKKY
jgi:hypothetical protein